MAVVGVLLAGGVSKRFGGDKGLALVEGEPMVRRIAKTLYEAAGQVYLSVKTAERGVKLSEAANPYVSGFLVDEFQQGPLSGILTAARRLDADVLLTASLDVPMLKPETLKNLLNLHASSGADASSVVWDDGNVETLIQAISRETVVSYVENILNNRQALTRPSDTLRSANRLLLAHASKLTNNPSEFININTPEDLTNPKPRSTSKTLVKDSLMIEECSRLYKRAAQEQGRQNNYAAALDYLAEASTYLRRGVSRIACHALVDSAYMFKQGGMEEAAYQARTLASTLSKN
ncbi:MAG: molybdenum cofactor guanylyltransferase [Candidatus Caldarchaeum sp.]|nr:molybdenum cofactor guanylyltransferase [Candidatus Caldarchaeum sp.]